MNIETVQHNGFTYTVDLDGIGEAIAEFAGYKTGHFYRGRDVFYLFTLSGAHEPAPIEILMVNPREDWGTDGAFNAEWDRLLWADDESLFDSDLFSDLYTDALNDEMKKVISETWD